MVNKLRVLVFNSDLGGCWLYRVKIPMAALIAFGVECTAIPFLPSKPGQPGSDMWALVKLLENFDLIIIQRMTSIEYFLPIWSAAHLMAKPVILEVDDDYLHLEKSNPCFFGTAIDNPLLREIGRLREEGKIEEVNKRMPMLEQSRLQGLEGYKKLLTMVDGVTVTTKELAETIRPYNKNICVLPNNVEQVYWERDYVAEECNDKGQLIKTEEQKEVEKKTGMSTVPSFYPERDDKGNVKVLNGRPIFNRIVRVGYTGTSSHGEDFKSIEEYWVRLTEKYANKIWPVYIGDPYFCDKQINHRGRRMFIQQQPYDMYKLNIRNLDIGMAPLEPTPFNMSKSDIKAVELGMWGIAPVLPNYITYARTFKHGETALFYNNGKEFYECMELLINDHVLRETIGNNARNYVYNNRLESRWAEPRHKFYKETVEAKRPHSFIRVGEKVNV